MKPLLLLAPLLLAATAPVVADPYLWLEEIEGARALDQVKAWNAETERALTGDESYEVDRLRARAILDDEQQIAMPDQVIGDRVLNLWRDAANPRGLWRVASLDSYAAGAPEWTTLIDVDALGKQEGKSWVWHGARCLEPDYARCLIALSPGGTDAQVMREFDTTTGMFVADGFTLPVAKSEYSWVDRDHLLVATDFGDGTLTSSGYPRIVKSWTRGTTLATARTLMTAAADTVGINVGASVDKQRRWPTVMLSKTYWDAEYSVLLPDGRLVRVPLPEGADQQDVIDGRVIAKLNKPAGDFPAGALVAYSLSEVAAGRAPAAELVFSPSAAQAVEEVAASDDVLWVKILDDVSGKLLALRRGADGRWSGEAKPLAANNTVHIASVAGARDMAFATVEGMLTPPTLYAVPATGAVRTVQSLPAKFDAALYDVTQRFATSKDGTKVPYFLVTKKGAKQPTPALIHAYGGFRAAQTPTYLTEQPYRAGPLALFWAERGHAYVLANIRGGGEYGPRWHQAALREKRQNSFDDLHAVAEDLVSTGVSTKGKIAISGRSNGGVLVGAAMNQRPDLYGAVISGSPLIDMKRYSHLLAGASWMDEYGNPDVPADWAFMKAWSPYQNIKTGVRYPPIFLYGSTKDDRVHPGHARKTVAKLKAYGNTVYFHEYMEGGHAVGADHAEDARRAALLEAFLEHTLEQ